MTGKCNCCGRTKDLRLGSCWDCANCESVIADGTDMYEKPIPETEGLSTHMNKVKYIIDKYKKPEKHD